MTVKIVIESAVDAAGKHYGPDIVIEQTIVNSFPDDLFITVGTVKTRINPGELRKATEILKMV